MDNKLLFSKISYDIAEVTFYTLITWETVLFSLYIFVRLDYPLEIGLAINWFFWYLLQIWFVKQTLPQFSIRLISLTLIIEFMILLLVILLYLLWLYNDLLLLILLGGLIGQMMHFLALKYTLNQEDNPSLFILSALWFISCSLGSISIKITNLSWQCVLLVASTITAGLSASFTVYQLSSFNSSSQSGLRSRWYVKVTWLASIFLIHLLAYLWLPSSYPESIQATTIKMEAIAVALENYHLDHGHYPSTEQGLEQLLGQYYTRPTLPQDSWQQKLYYRSDTQSYKLMSLGPDKQLESEDDIILISRNSENLQINP